MLVHGGGVDVNPLHVLANLAEVKENAWGAYPRKFSEDAGKIHKIMKEFFGKKYENAKKKGKAPSGTVHIEKAEINALKLQIEKTTGGEEKGDIKDKSGGSKQVKKLEGFFYPLLFPPKNKQAQSAPLKT